MPMMHVLLLLLTQTTPADHVLDRFSKLRTAHPQMAVTYSVTAGGPSMQGTALLDGTKRLYMTMQGEGLNYTAAVTPTSVIELDNVERLYDEHGGNGRAFVPPSRITGSVALFPAWLYSNDVRELVPKNTPFIPAEAETIAGQKCDRVVAKFSNVQGASGTVDASIDGSGVVRRLRVYSQSPMGSSDVTWRFTQMKPMPTADAAKFDLKLPLGYVPYALPDAGTPLGVGENFPMTGWSAASGKLDLKTKLGAKGGLVAILGADSVPSAQSRESLTRVAHNVPTAILSDNGRGGAGIDGFDPAGKLFETVNPPSTPFFALVDGNGKIRRLWMGFDASKAADFEKDIRNAFAAKE